MLTFLKRKKVQELIGLVVILGTTTMIGIDIGRKLSKKKERRAVTLFLLLFLQYVNPVSLRDSASLWHILSVLLDKCFKIVSEHTTVLN